MSQLITKNTQLFEQISQLIEQARQYVQRNVDTIMVQTYWEIGRLIIEDEQEGKSRAEYGKAQFQQLSEQSSKAFWPRI